METKTAQAITLWRAGDVKKALGIFVTFKIGFTKDQRRTLQLASEGLSGHKNFYAQLGIDTDAELEKAINLITERYL